MEVTLSQGGDGVAGTISAIATLLGGLSWPVLIGFALFLFRDELRKLIGRVRKLGHGDSSIDFDEGMNQADLLAAASPAIVEAQSEDTSIQTEESGAPAAELPGEVVTRAETDPVRADARSIHPISWWYDETPPEPPLGRVLRSWDRIASMLSEFQGKTSGPAGLASSLFGYVQYLKMFAGLPPTVAELILQLQQLKNAALNGEDVSPSEASRYEQNALQVIRALKSVERNL